MDDLILLPSQPQATIISNPPTPNATPDPIEKVKQPPTPSHDSQRIDTPPNMTEEHSTPERLESPGSVDTQPQTQETPTLRRSTRIKQRPKHLSSYVCSTKVTTGPKYY